MTTERGHTAEDEYFRNQESERRQDDAWERQRTARTVQSDREALEARRARQAARGAEDSVPHARRDARRGLNRLIVAGWGELLALEEAIRIVPAADRRGSLPEKAARRRVFRQDLSAAVVALGGVPANGASVGARSRSWARDLRRLVAGPHGGDAYAACARAAESATNEYTRVLRSGLPNDVRFGVERQHAEIDLDCRELRRLRWGGSPASAAPHDDG
jgi:hypothetical protein